jgi:hypothetical protein
VGKNRANVALHCSCRRGGKALLIESSTNRPTEDEFETEFEDTMIFTPTTTSTAKPKVSDGPKKIALYLLLGVIIGILPVALIIIALRIRKRRHQRQMISRYRRMGVVRSSASASNSTVSIEMSTLANRNVHSTTTTTASPNPTIQSAPGKKKKDGIKTW